MGDPLTPVHWKEGLFLRPHHFQQDALYSKRFIGWHLGSMTPFYWGVKHVEIDEGRLEDGVFVLRRLELVLPSGEIVQVPENTKITPRKILEPGPGRESKMRVFFGVRRLREQDPNLSLEGVEGPDPARFLADRRLVYERNSGRDSQEIEFDFLNGRIFFEGESMEDFDTVAIAELVPPEVGLPLSRVSRQYVPPVIRVGASPVLAAQIRQLHASAAAKAARLAARADAEGVRSGTAVQGDVLSLWKLHTIHGYLPYLRDAVDFGTVHPYPLYVEMCRFAGQLASFSSGNAEIEMPTFDHQDPGRCFGEVFGLVHRMLDELVPSNFARIPLIQEGFRYTADLREEWLETRNRFFAAIRADAPEALLERWFKATAKVAARPRIDRIVEQRLRGVPTAKVDRPRVLPPRDGFVWFELMRDSADWQEVRSDRTIAIHLAAEAGMTPEELAKSVFELYVVFGG